jgi:mono/diheme cytochrome c family protein
MRSGVCIAASSPVEPEEGETAMLPAARAVLSLSLAASVTAWAISAVLAQSGDARFSNPARFMAPTGEGLYADLCQGCHMPGGVGAVGAGTYPALAGNPNLASAGFPLASWSIMSAPTSAINLPARRRPPMPGRRGRDDGGPAG